MGIFDLFKSKGKTAQKPAELQTNLICPHCGSVYRIGEDTIISRPEDVLKDFPNLAGTFDMSRPDLVTHIGTVDNGLRKNINQKNLQKMEAINTILKKGQSRYWYCSKCKNENNPCPYPSVSQAIPNDPPVSGSGQFRCAAGHTRLTFDCDACRRVATSNSE